MQRDSDDGCIKQFNIYDVTGGGTPVKLFSITAPSGANSAVTGITGSGTASLKSGVHTFAATAERPMARNQTQTHLLLLPRSRPVRLSALA